MAEIKKAIYEDWPRAIVNLATWKEQGIVDPEEADMMTSLYHKLYNRPSFRVPRMWNAKWEALPPEIVRHIFSFLGDPGLTEVENWVRPRRGDTFTAYIEYDLKPRCAVDLHFIYELRKVNKSFAHELRWVTNVKTEQMVVRLGTLFHRVFYHIKEFHHSPLKTYSEMVKPGSGELEKLCTLGKLLRSEEFAPWIDRTLKTLIRFMDVKLKSCETTHEHAQLCEGFRVMLLTGCNAPQVLLDHLTAKKESRAPTA